MKYLKKFNESIELIKRRPKDQDQELSEDIEFRKACVNGDIDTVKKLANPSLVLYRNAYSIKSSAEYGHKEIVKYLWDNFKGEDGLPPLTKSIYQFIETSDKLDEEGKRDMIKFLNKLTGVDFFNNK